MSSGQQRLDFDAAEPIPTRDEEARRVAVDPSRNIALEASAGTGKTRVLVDRYVGLLAAGIEPRHILAITFTRKAAAEMRQRILDELQRRFAAGHLTRERWREIRDRLGEIAISTIDAFCFALLREFPLEADVDPGFELADETETPRLVDLALDRALRIGRGLAVDDMTIALVFADLGEFQLRAGLARLIDRRLVARSALARFVRGPHVDAEEAVARFLAGFRAAMASQPGGVERVIASGPDEEEFHACARDLRRLSSGAPLTPAEFQGRLGRVRDYLLTQKGEPRKRLEFKKALFRSTADYERHKAAVLALGPHMAALLERYRHDINLVLARGVERLFAIALDAYRDILQKQNVLDFSEVLVRTLQLLRQMDEFSRSRFRLESRYRHVLVDEFQDTSRAQWELVELLIRSWGEGESVAAGVFPPSIFIVGDRKQSIYGFRDAEVEVLDGAARFIQALRPGGRVRHAITRSFRSVRELLAFVNDAFTQVAKLPERGDAFRYDEDDAFPLAGVVSAAESTTGRGAEAEALGMIATSTDERQAEAVAEEIARLLLDHAVVRDRQTGVRRPVRPGDIAILFRTREAHRLFEDALRRRHVPFYVYKGLGFFDADEIKDLLALMAFLAAPDSNLRAAAFLRSRFVRLSDAGLASLAPDLAESLVSATATLKGGPPSAPDDSRSATRRGGSSDPPTEDDRARLELARASVRQWLPLVDRLPPAELVDRVLAESAYMVEIAGQGVQQARENLKKIRSLVRRLQNRGYATLTRVVDHFSRMTAGGDESNAIIDAEDAVNLMTVHAAKGLEFPVVFVANLAKGSGGSLDPIRVSAPPFQEGEEGESTVAIGDHQSDADRDAEAREIEEGKRLLYVAVTRARDRLYLATTIDRSGRFAPAKGSLGRVLSADLAQMVTLAATNSEESLAIWPGPTTEHRFRICRPPEAEPRILPLAAVGDILEDDFAPLVSTSPRRETATAGASELAADESVPGVSNPLTGALVHRALASRIGLHGEAPANLADAIAALLRDEERMDGRAEAAIAQASRVYRRVLADVELRALLASGRVEHEVDFSLRRDDGVIVRGAIDCIVASDAGDRVTVVEIKTGVPATRHDAQLAVYVDAARALFPSSHVEGRLVYLRA